MRSLICILVISLVFSSCFGKHPRIDYSNQKDSLTLNSVVNDTSKVLMAELPLYIDSTDYLMYPLKLENINNKNNKRILDFSSYSNSNYSGSGIYLDSYQPDYISGEVTNIVFENTKTKEQRLLTKNVINITSTQFLREIYKKTHLQYMLYSVIDRDLNKDSRMDYLDITSLYISKLDGTAFTKLTGQYHNYVDGKLIIQELKYYYRTIEDINKDGIFNKVDKYHYYYIDFAYNPYKIVEYFPLKLITK